MAGLNGHAVLEGGLVPLAESTDAECSEVSSMLPKEMWEEWKASPERRRWRYWDQARSTADGIDVGGDITRADAARRAAVTDFRTRIAAERLNASKGKGKK